MMETVKVLIVDKREIIRAGIEAILKNDPHIEVLGHYGSCTEGIEKASEPKPDDLLVSTELPDDEYIEVISAVSEKLSQAKILVLTCTGR